MSNFKINRDMNWVGVDHFRIELVERIPCEKKEDFLKREGYWIRELNATLNTKIAGRSKQQYDYDMQDFFR